jgi:putative ABC transport system permease protein
MDLSKEATGCRICQRHLLLRHLVFGVTPFDLAAFAAVAIMVLLAILFACWLPATRAVKVDPMVALR